jgi:hypothetical protein
MHSSDSVFTAPACRLSDRGVLLGPAPRMRGIVFAYMNVGRTGELSAIYE